MKVKNVNIEYAHTNGFASSSFDGICHTKVLPYLSVVQATEGSYDIQLDNAATYNTGSKGFFIAPANAQQRIVHRADPLSKRIVCRWVFLKIRINDLYLFDEKFSLPTVLPDSYKSDMSELFDSLFASNNVFDQHVCYYRIVKLLSEISTEKEQVLPTYIETALRYIKENYKEKITVEDIANETHLSPSYLFSVFKKHIGVSPISYLNNYRLSAAADLLLGTDRSITQIAQETGINDSVYFNKLFKKQYQMSPSEYRRTCLIQQ